MIRCTYDGCVMFEGAAEEVTLFQCSKNKEVCNSKLCSPKFAFFCPKWWEVVLVGLNTILYTMLFMYKYIFLCLKLSYRILWSTYGSCSLALIVCLSTGLPIFNNTKTRQKVVVVFYSFFRLPNRPSPPPLLWCVSPN